MIYPGHTDMTVSKRIDRITLSRCIPRHLAMASYGYTCAVAIVIAGAEDGGRNGLRCWNAGMGTLLPNLGKYSDF